MENFKFEKFVFGTSLAGWSIAKYSYGEQIKISAEHDEKPSTDKFFDSVDDYEEWIDSIVDDETAIYNKALAVDLVLDAMDAR